MKVLLIEDDKNISETVVEMLELNNMDVDCVHNCDRALHYLSNTQPDVIVSDVMLPDGNGFDILKFLKNETTIIDYIPFIFLSGMSTREDIRYGMNLGADDYLTKPFQYKELINTIHSVSSKASSKHDHVVRLETELSSKNQLIDQVKSITSHDLRSRIVKISNLISLTREGKFPKDKFIDWMLQSGEFMDEVVYKIHQLLNDSVNIPSAKDDLFTPKRMWHIEDDYIQRVYVKSLVDKAFNDIDYQSFEDANTALTLMLGGQMPDYILLDINMPGINGFEFLDLMKQNNLNSEVIMLSSSISDSDIVESYNYQNVVGYEVKPLKINAFEQLFGLT